MMEFILIACLSFSCPQLARVCYVYFLSKFVEYLDTVSAFSDIIRERKGPIFIAATRWNFCRAKVATSFKHVRNPCDIAATNRTENRTWFTRAILELHLIRRDKNCIELPRQKSPL